MTTRITRNKTLEVKIDNIANAVSRKVLVEAGEAVAARARAKLKQSGKSVTGSAEKKIHVTSAFRQGEGWIVRVGGGPPLKFIVSGRRKGARQPPVEPIKKWMELRGIQPREIKRDRQGRFGNKDKALTSLAWAISKAISRDGIPPFPFLQDAYKEMKSEIRRIIREGIKRELRSGHR